MGHDRIVERIGAGRMGVCVYRAHDDRLDRDVALAGAESTSVRSASSASTAQMARLYF